MKTVLLLFVYIIFPLSDALEHTEMKSLFDEKRCIEGILVSTPQGPTLITMTSIPQQSLKSHLSQVSHSDTSSAESVEQLSSRNTTTSSMPIHNLQHNKEKTSMSLINELARHNKIQHQYLLINEEGPAHSKLFTVTLKLGNEEYEEDYEAEGASIKEAQHSAAAMALQQTSFKHPPLKSSRRSEMVAPTVELNALAMKRGESAIYTLENGTSDPPIQNYVEQPNYYQRQTIHGKRYNYDPHGKNFTRNYHPQYENRHYEQDRHQHTHGKLFSIRLRVGEREYPGVGYTVQAARHDAAAKAIEDIKQKEVDSTQQCPASNGNKVVPEVDACNDLNTELKSPISLVHEIALKRDLNIVFEILSETGPSHMKVFVTQCRVGDLIADGEGNSKKISKKRAAEKMLDELSKLGPLPSTSKIVGLKSKPKRKVNKKKQRNLIKVNAERSSDFTNQKIGKGNPVEAVLALLGYSSTPTVASGDFQQSKSQTSGTNMLNSGSGSAPTELKKMGQAQLPKKSPQIKKSVRAKDQLLTLAQLLGVEIQFSDFPKANHEVFLTLVSLSTSPPQVCLGEGPTTDTSYEKAALEALNLLSKLGLDNVTPKQKSNSPDGSNGSANKPQVDPKSRQKQNLVNIVT